MIKTMAQLKRDAKDGKLFVEMILRCGDNNIPERLKGRRQIVDANSVGIKILTQEGQKSELNIESAALLEYTDEYINIYSAGERDLAAAENAIIDEWLKIASSEDFKWREEADSLSDGLGAFYQQKHFFKDRKAEYLNNSNIISTRRIKDNKVRGELFMQYKIIT